jgi:acyl carrier protein phosphodiesterase
MNYLGHAVLSFDEDELLLGNMIGDFIKGKEALNAFPARVKAGLLLHRKIDTFTDAHPAIREAKALFREHYGLYSGAVVDTLMDYFVANDPLFFPSEHQLAQFSAGVYERLGRQEPLFPEPFKPYFASMKQHNWLLGYRNHAGLRQSLNGLKRRAGRIEEMDTAYTLFQEKFDVLHSVYANFADDVIKYVKVEIDKSLTEG